GFALLSQPNGGVQRMYFQCEPEADPTSLSEAEIWDTLQARVPGTDLLAGPIFERDALRFRSYDAGALRHGRAALIGEAAHTLPPTGANGMNLAIGDVGLLNQALRELLLNGNEKPIDAYESTASKRIWKSQHFSWWMTNMLHLTPEASKFD